MSDSSRRDETPGSSHCHPEHSSPSTSSLGAMIARQRGPSRDPSPEAPPKRNKGTSLVKKAARGIQKGVDWFSTAEPSRRAFEEAQRKSFSKAGVPIGHPAAAAKLGTTATKLPPDAPLPTSKEPLSSARTGKSTSKFPGAIVNSKERLGSSRSSISATTTSSPKTTKMPANTSVSSVGSPLRTTSKSKSDV
jgi:hypothetical protein